MLSLLRELTNESLPSVPPPRHGRQERTVVFRTPSLSDRPSFAIPRKAKGAKLRGLRYEESVCNWLVERLREPWVCFDHQWLSYVDSFGKTHYCQPDFFAISVDRGLVLVIEVKLTRVAKAWYQLNHLYMPVLRSILPAFSFACVEIASKIAPVDTPEKVRVIHKLEDFHVGQTSFLKVPF